MSRNRYALYGLAVGLSVVTGLAFVSAPAQAADNFLPASAETPFDPEGVSIDNAAADHQYRFRVPVPPGGHLEPVSEESADPSAGVLVVDQDGQTVGAYDLAWAQDANNEPVPTRYVIRGHTLIQEVEFDAATAFPVVFDIIYNEVSAGDDISLMRVDVPSYYVYNPSLGALHDYCTSSPDEFPNPAGANANFRGPCAYHDLCLEYSWASRQTCNNWLLADLVENCEHWYSWYNPVRYACIDTAGVYWAAVTAATWT